MLSQLVQFKVVDAAGHQARLADLTIDLSTGDYPTVTTLLVGDTGRGLRTLEWARVQRFLPAERRVEAANLSDLPPAPVEPERAVLLRSQILDSTVLDLSNTTTTRANDLWLLEMNQQLRLRGVDVGAWAILRRLGQGWLGQGSPRNLLDWKDVEFLRGGPQAARRGHDYHRRVTRLPPTEIARLAEALPYLHATELLTLIPDALAADVLEAMSTARQVQVFEELDRELAERLLALMAPDLAADLVGQLEPALAQELLAALNEPARHRLVDLLRYPPDSAGGIMTNDLVLAEAGVQIQRARQLLRDELRRPDFVYYVYVVDQLTRPRLRGVLTLRDLLIADEHDQLQDVMNPALITIDPLETASAAAQRVADNGFAALPVVANDGRLLGAITVDAAVAVLAPARWRDVAPRVFS
jgi:magnesium transporter